MDAAGRPLGPAEERPNTITEGGRAWIGQRIQSNSPPANTISYLAVGTSTVAPNATQTALLGEVARKAIGTIITTTLTGPSPYFTCLVSFATNEAIGVLAEMGLFNSASGGTMIGRLTFTTQDKTTTNLFHATYNVSV